MLQKKAKAAAFEIEEWYLGKKQEICDEDQHWQKRKQTTKKGLEKRIGNSIYATNSEDDKLC